MLSQFIAYTQTHPSLRSDVLAIVKFQHRPTNNTFELLRFASVLLVSTIFVNIIQIIVDKRENTILKLTEKKRENSGTRKIHGTNRKKANEREILSGQLIRNLKEKKRITTLRPQNNQEKKKQIITIQI